jgi:hypothetical protein
MKRLFLFVLSRIFGGGTGAGLAFADGDWERGASGALSLFNLFFKGLP